MANEEVDPRDIPLDNRSLGALLRALLASQFALEQLMVGAAGKYRDDLETLKVQAKPMVDEVWQRLASGQLLKEMEKTDGTTAEEPDSGGALTAEGGTGAAGKPTDEEPGAS